MDLYGGRGYDPVQNNLRAAENLLEDEPGFAAPSGNYGGQASFNLGRESSAAGQLQGLQPTFQRSSRDGGRNSYTEDPTDDIDMNSGWAGNDGIGAIDAPSRRTNRFAGGSNPSQGSIGSDGGNNSQSRFDQRPGNYVAYTGARPQTGPSNHTGAFGGGGDILDQAMSRPNDMYGDDRKSQVTGLLSDVESHFNQREDDMLSQYMGQSEYGNASQLGANDYAPRPIDPPAPVMSRTGSRRAQVLERQGLTTAGSKAEPSGRRPPTAGVPPKSSNHGIFLGSQDIDEKKDTSIRRQGSVIPKGTLGGSSQASGEDPSLRMGRAKSAGFGMRGTPDIQDDAVSANSRRSAAVAGLFGTTPEKPETNVNGLRSLSNPPARSSEVVVHRAPSHTPSIHENKTEYLNQKKKEELDRLQEDVQKLKERIYNSGNEYETQIIEYKEKNRQELESIEKANNETLLLLDKDKEKILGTLQVSIQKEKEKMEQLYTAELFQKEKQHQTDLIELQKALQRETKYIEQSLEKQEEMSTQLVKVKQQTIDLGEIVQGSLKQREEELRRRENEMAKQEAELFENEQLQIELEEKKLADEERRLVTRKVVLHKLKQTRNEEINALRDQRQQTIQNHAKDEERHRLDERNAKENLTKAKKQLELQTDLRKKKRRELEIELQSKETEATNCQRMFEKEKSELENDYSERHLRSIQAKTIEIEERRQALAFNNQELRKDHRMLEKKRDLVHADDEQLDHNEAQLRTQIYEFESVTKEVEQTSERLAIERELYLSEKAVLDRDTERINKMKHDSDVQKSILQSDVVRATEFEHELTHRENKLNMLKFNDKQNVAGVGGVPAYTSCYQLKQQPGIVVNEQNKQQAPIQQQYQPQTDQAQQMQYQRRFDYNNYMADLNTRLGHDHWFGQNNQAPPMGQEDESGYGTTNNYATFNEQRSPQFNGQQQRAQQNAFGSVSVGQNYYQNGSLGYATNSNDNGSTVVDAENPYTQQNFRNKIQQKLGNCHLASNDVSGQEELPEEEDDDEDQQDLQQLGQQQYMQQDGGDYEFDSQYD